ncbi:hypothetical protein Godav_001158 [Gossypium davidsonii]|uniref:Myb/SANT-like domain-containing protein n=1 Tax=Gossypium davidsonii TaxID=34287 RepID=A0A7J8T3V0_GOSDV|nr:hypothetical protein [Gossypium davidsonii]
MLEPITQIWDSRTLKRDWTIVYDMLSGKDNSGFGWNEHRQMVVVEDVIVIKQPVNLDIVVSLIMTNLLPYMQKIEPMGKMLKQLQILLKK